MLKSSFIFITSLFLILNFSTANGQNLAASKNDLARIENYLQNIKYLSAKFTQESSDGSIATGKFYLSRPGKMRIEYDAPTPILVVVNGPVLAYQDTELEETSYLTTNSTPASFLTRNNISFSAEDIEVTNFVKQGNFLKVSVVKKNKKEAGEFTLVFENDPIKFVMMQVKDDLDQVTKVTLENKGQENKGFSGKIDDSLFIIKNNQLPK